MDVPDVSYARSGDVAIAYQVVGEGPPDLVFLPFLSNLYTLWQFPPFAEFGRRLAKRRRLIVVNPRGVGLSDRQRGFTIESRIDDIRAVMDEVGTRRPPLLGIGEAAATCALFAASYPDRVDRLVLFAPWVRTVDYSNPRERDASCWRRRNLLRRTGAAATSSRTSLGSSTRSGPMTRSTSSGSFGTSA